MVEAQHGGVRRYATSVVVLVAALAVVGLGILTVLPRQSDTAAVGFRSLRDLASAYARVLPGQTRASQLGRLGFDSTTPNVEVLSYLGMIERFMPRDSAQFDRLDPRLQTCIEARDRCTALVFKPGSAFKVRAAGMFSMFGLGAAQAAASDPVVTLLVQDGRVAYKTISGIPQQRPVAAPAIARSITAEATPVAYRIGN
ncbi:MAG: hypothetical protein WDN03_17590 [Rhizomicrobium sp.]